MEVVGRRRRGRKDRERVIKRFFHFFVFSCLLLFVSLARSLSFETQMESGSSRRGGGEIPIEPSSFDLIVLGTGLPESLVAR